MRIVIFSLFCSFLFASNNLDDVFKIKKVYHVKKIYTKEEIKKIQKRLKNKRYYKSQEINSSKKSGTKLD
jgi:hypothetical protein